MNNLSKIVAAKLEGEGLNLTNAAEKIGVSLVSLRGVINGKSVPNARSLAKYAAFLGLTEEEVKAAGADGAKTKGGKGKKKAAKGGKKKAAKQKGGRKAKKAAKAEVAEKPAKGRPGPKPGRKAGRKPGRKAGGSIASAISTIQSTLADAEAVLGDPLVRQVIGATASQRKAIQFVLSQFA